MRKTIFDKRTRVATLREPQKEPRCPVCQHRWNRHGELFGCRVYSPRKDSTCGCTQKRKPL